MTGATRANLRPAFEVLGALAATGVAFYLGARFDIADFLSQLSQQSRLGVDMANLGPGLLVLAGAMGVVSVRRWKESVDERRELDETRDVLAGSEDRYRSLVDVSPAPIVLSDANAHIVFANDAAVHLLRAPSATALLTQDITRFVDPGSMPRFAARAEAVMRGENVVAHDVSLQRMDGTTVNVQILSVPASIDGAPGVQTVLQDVSHMAEIADALQRACVDTVEAMARLAEVRDPYTYGHQKRVSELGAAMARYMGLDASTVESVRIAGLVHDIGKINVPVEILSKPGRLTETEFDLIKTHAQRGFEILEPIEFPWPIAEIVHQHHERLDGSGYPRGISDGDIRLESRILAVADTVEAVASDRPYRPALGLGAALKIATEGRGTLYDPACVDACAAVAESVIASN